jgi:hypothetical protein
MSSPHASARWAARASLKLSGTCGTAHSYFLPCASSSHSSTCRRATGKQLSVSRVIRGCAFGKLLGLRYCVSLPANRKHTLFH